MSKKTITGWSIASMMTLLNFYFGFGIWTPLFIVGAILFIPPVAKYVRKKLKIKSIIVTAAASCLIVVGLISWYTQNDKNDIIYLPTDNSTSQSTTTQSSTKPTSKTEDVFEGVESVSSISPDSIPKYSDEPFIIINDNEPEFDKNVKAEAFEKYTALDKYGRCVDAYACVCKETMPTEKRGNISSVKPSGWQHTEYDFVDGKSLFNRCHLIGFQLTAENANERNLITGTRYMNTEGMLPFENMVADYIKETNNHVLYRVTPIFKDKELVARGVQMQAYSLEDNGDGICFNVYCYNVQPNVKINYKDGTSQLSNGKTTTTVASGTKQNYVLNTKSKKFHNPDCSGAEDINPDNKESYKGTREELINKGYSPCGKCNP